MSRTTEDLPERLGLLRDTAAVECLTRGVLSGHEDPPLVALVRASEPIGYAGSRADTLPLRELFDNAMRLHDEVNRTRADAWLAPRLHATLRLTRAEAADSGLWNFIALIVAPDYVVWRHLPKKGAEKRVSVNPVRFCGLHYRQAIARLWWAAELFRDGEDYSPAVTFCRNQDALNTILSLDVIDHRPTARAVTRLMEQGTVTVGREVNALSTAINSAGSTLLYDVLAPDEPADADALRAWIEEGDMAPPVSDERLPHGPDDGAVPQDATDFLVKQFEELFENAPVRGRAPSDDRSEE
ncbi:DUF6339 family protein [Streptomyces harbinensis]|uniref:DUF6339 family protein n=1 Tax=Streptomyces harbinensis TaxID=1176198 RepID=UPI00367B5717